MILDVIKWVWYDVETLENFYWDMCYVAFGSYIIWATCYHSNKNVWCVIITFTTLSHWSDDLSINEKEDYTVFSPLEVHHSSITQDT